MTKKTRHDLFVAVFVLVAICSFADDRPGPVISAEWLNQHIHDPDIRIVDVSFDKKGYDAGHIPNAVFVDWRTDLAEPDAEHYYILPRQEFEALMSRIGVTTDTRLIFYDDFDNRLAIRALWVSEYYGHESTAILEGGIQAWRAGGYQVTKNAPHPDRTSYAVRSVNRRLNADKEYVQRNLSSPDVLFVDGRPAGMYTGVVNGKEIHTGEPIARRGHLPDAVNLPWKSLMDQHSAFLDRDTLAEMFKERGIDQDGRTVVFYCNEGVHAAFDWFVAAKMLGFQDARIYDGSMSEWAEDWQLPLVRGRE
jgi:thiosulfate/3-mercaptopyruvate sulfurtransferase